MKRYMSVLFAFPASCVLAGQPLGIAPVALSQAESLQAVIDRGGPLVFVPKGNYTLSETLRLRSDLVLYFEPGTVIEAAEGAFKGIRESLIVLENLDHVRIVSDGSIFRMRKADYRKPDLYVDSEFRHVAAVRGCRDVAIDAGSFFAGGGDGIYLGPFVQPDKSRIQNQRITIRRVTCDDNTRQGISIVSCIDCEITDCILEGTNGKSPQAGIDIEPEVGDTVTAAVLRTQSNGNRGPAYMVSFQHLKVTDPPCKAIFKDCTYSNVPQDQPSLRMTGIFNDESKPTGYLKANLPKGTTIRWDSLEWKK